MTDDFVVGGILKVGGEFGDYGCGEGGRWWSGSCVVGNGGAWVGRMGNGSNGVDWMSRWMVWRDLM